MRSMHMIDEGLRIGSRGGLALALLGLGLLGAAPARAAETAAAERPLLVLPKGKPVTVTGLTMKGGAPAAEATTVTARWDDEGMTVIFDCTDTHRVAEWAEARDSEKTWKDDSVAVLLDVGHRHTEVDNLALFKLSLAGGLQDCRGKRRDIGFNVEGVTSEIGLPPVLSTWQIMPIAPEQRKASESPVPPGHWQGTIRIPWKGLGAKPAEGEIWGVNFTRIDQPGLNFMAWAPFEGDFEELPSFGHLAFVGKDAPSDDKAVAALRESARQAHAGAAKLSINEGNVLILRGKQAASVADFRVIKSGAPVREAVNAALTWDSDGLDVVFDCVDDGICAEQKGHDNIKLWRDDSVYVWVDPGHTHDAARGPVLVQISAGGEVHDARGGDPKFDLEGLVAEAGPTGKGWRAHLKLPWKGLGTEPPKPGDAWGVNLTRMDQPGKTDYEKMENSSWAALPEGDPAQIDRWGHIVFAAEGGQGTAGDPSVTAAQQAIKTRHAAWSR